LVSPSPFDRQAVARRFDALRSVVLLRHFSLSAPMTVFSGGLRVFRQEVNMRSSRLSPLAPMCCLALVAFAAGPPPVHAAASVTFPHGVASGDVTPFSAVLWTRVQPSGKSASPEPLVVEVALDSAFSRIHFRRTVSAQPQNDFTVKVIALPLLPNQVYHYRWRHKSADSPAGTFKTAPTPNAPADARFTWTGDSDGTRVGGSAAWNDFDVFEAVRGEYGDFFIYLGDTIYADSQKRSGKPAATLSEYREVYKEARGYPHLRNLFQAVSTYATWDDHEVRDDWSGATIDPVLYANGRRAFSEYMPTVDFDFPVAGCAGVPRFRVFRWGADVELIILDTHTCRSDHARAACTYPSPPFPPGTVDLAPTLPAGFRAAFPAFFPPLAFVPNCLPTINDPSRTVLGDLQKQLFKDALRTSNARFKFILSPSTIGQAYVDPYSRWEGFAAERAEIIGFIADHDIEGVVFLSTDDHRNLVHQVFDDRVAERPAVAKEFVTGPVAYATDQALVLGFFGLPADTDCSLPANAPLPGCTALAAEQRILRVVAGVTCGHLNEYSYGLVEVDAALGVATVTLKDKHGQVIHDQLNPAIECTGQVGR
jgi:alkaline phosphatase D